MYRIIGSVALWCQYIRVFTSVFSIRTKNYLNKIIRKYRHVKCYDWYYILIPARLELLPSVFLDFSKKQIFTFFQHRPHISCGTLLTSCFSV